MTALAVGGWIHSVAGQGDEKETGWSRQQKLGQPPGCLEVTAWTAGEGFVFGSCFRYIRFSFADNTFLTFVYAGHVCLSLSLVHGHTIDQSVMVNGSFSKFLE